MAKEKEIIIVTGSSGRIGTSLVKRLGEKYRIIGFELLKAIYASDSEELVPVDISSDESVEQAMRHIRHFYGDRIASVIHLAAYYSFSDQNYAKYDAITVKGTQRLLRGLQKFHVDQFIFSSTMLVHQPCGLSEKIDESWPVKPSWAYPRSKVETEEIIHKERGNIPALILRIAGVYDDLCHSIPISQQIQRIYEKQLESHFFPGNLEHGAAFIHMDDLVDAIVIAVEKRKQLPPDETLIIGEPTTLSYATFQKEISALLFGREMKTYRIPKLFAKMGAWAQNHMPFMKKSFIQPWMIDIADDNYILDISKAIRVLGWQPKHTVERTLPKMVRALLDNPEQWYKQNGLKK